MGNFCYGAPVTWEILYDEIYEGFADQECSSTEFLSHIIPNELCSELFQGQIQLQTDFFFGKPMASDKDVYAEMVFRLTDDQKAKNPSLANHPIVLDIQKNWERQITLPNQNYKIKLKIALANILDRIEEDPYNINTRLKPLVSDDCFSLLAILSVIASTLNSFCFSEEDLAARDRDLLQMLPNGDRKAVKSDREAEKSARLEKCIMKEITWAKIHKKVKGITPEKKISTQIDFFTEVWPDQLLQDVLANEEGDHIGELSKKYVGEMYNARKEAPPRFRRVRTAIISRKSETGELCTYSTSGGVVDEFRIKWEALIPGTKLPVTKAEPEIVAVIDELIGDIPGDDNGLMVATRLEGIRSKEPCSMILAILSVIASSLSCFGEKGMPFDPKDKILYDCVLPPLPAKEASDALKRARLFVKEGNGYLRELKELLKVALNDNAERGEAYYLLYLQAQKEGNTNKSNDYLRQSVLCGYADAVHVFNVNTANDLYQRAENYKDIKQHCREYEQIMELRDRSVPNYGKVAYELYRFISGGKYSSCCGMDADYYLEISKDMDYPEAVEEWLSRNTVDITPTVVRYEGAESGKCYANTVNRYVNTFMESIPETWEWHTLPVKLDPYYDYLHAEVKNRCRFLLVDDDFEKNSRDLFRILQVVKAHDGSADDRHTQPDPKGIDLKWEIFIRHNSEPLHMLVDTALSRLSDYRIPVYILDDNKAAAQQLLSKHPLFYPVRQANLVALAGKPKPLLHFIVLGTSPVAHWLVREAFGVMGFRDNVIRTRITVLGENGKNFEAQLKGQFPGMSSEKWKIEGIELADISGIDCDLCTYKLEDHINEFTKETEFCYFAVAEGADDRNLELAARVREVLIRNAIQSKKSERLHSMPPVAFLCRNPQTAWLSNHMVVETEKKGNLWYNTRALIPFGMESELYTFENITGGTFGQLAKCIHYQYSGVTPQDVQQQTEAAVNSEKKYYQRQYNQDSSYSMALAMPYRLFQFRGDTQQIYPVAWNILSSRIFASVHELNELAKQIQKVSADQNQKVAEWEHARWVRWMLSRGWLPASFEESVFAYKNGNPRQQLFAAKLHPCICPYAVLKSLQEYLLSKCGGIKKDFFTADLRNVEMTGELLSLKWEMPQREEMVLPQDNTR